MRPVVAVSVLLLVTPACFGPAADGAQVDGGTTATGGGGGGTGTDGGGGILADAGTADGGHGGGISDAGTGGVSDGGPGGTTDAGAGGGTTDAGAFGDGGLFGDGGTACSAGETRCNGPRLQTCSGGTFAAPADCPTGQVCRGSGCVPVSACAGATPPCCATSADCGTLHDFYSCPECRPAADGPSCLAGVCESAAPTPIDFDVVADALGLPGSVRVTIRSAVITVYRGVTADGRLATCTMLLPPTGTGPHDAKDPTLDAVFSKPVDFRFSTGSDAFTAQLLQVPRGDQETVVFSVYDGTGGGGSLVGRGCTDLLAPTAGGRYTVTLK